MNWTNEAERKEIADAAISLVEEVGVSVEGSRSLDALEAAGANVDRERQVVCFSEALVRDAIGLCPRDILMAGADESKDVVLTDSAPARFSSAGCVAFTLDDSTGERRPSTLEDLRTATALFDELPQIDLVWTTVSATDAPIERRELIELYTMFCETSKPVGFQNCVGALGPLREVAAVLAGSLESFHARPRFSTYMGVASPFKIDGRLLDFHAAIAELGAPVIVSSGAMGGATGPVPVAGLVTLALAECLGAITAIQILSPGARLLFDPALMTLDMSTGSGLLGSPESRRMQVTALEVGHLLGLPTVSTGSAVDAKHSGLQAGYEKAMGFLMVGAEADIVSGGIGTMNATNLIFLPQIVVDAEIVSIVKRVLAPVEVTPETVAKDLIAEVGIGGSFLGLNDTRDRIRAGEYFRPTVSSHESYAAWRRSGRDELTAAREQIQVLLTRHAERELPLSEDQHTELARICDVAP
jgi:trimethylamine--corrinoid protein Co-methyltransferase